MSNDKALSWSYAEGIVEEASRMARAREQAHDLGIQPVSPATGNLLATLAATHSVRTIAEVGTGTGVSGLYLLSASEDSVLTSIDVESEAQNFARESFTATGVRSGRFRIINGRSADILPRLADASYDLVFIDGDPLEADGDVTEAIRMLRKGGILVVAHALHGDRVADPARRDEVTVAMRNLGKEIVEAEEIFSSLIPLGDGVILGVKR